MGPMKTWILVWYQNYSPLIMIAPKHFCILIALAFVSASAAPTAKSSSPAANSSQDAVFYGDISFWATLQPNASLEDWPVLSITSSATVLPTSSDPPPPPSPTTEPAPVTTTQSPPPPSAHPPPPPPTTTPARPIIPIKEFPHGGPRLP
ncbi:hypothetical protein B0H19DRAFT_154945 [Mycena capillaripes]|nr:hypothetical protein B0H19DRAFT_154945 [Mycena capillaripes]